MHLLYLCGGPGAGKSAALAAILDRLTGPLAARSAPFAHAIYAGPGGQPVVYLGRAGGPFPGTDRLSMAVIRDVEPWLAALRPPFLLGEGDRLAHDRFFSGCRGLGYTLSLAHLATPLAAARRESRGSVQDPAWVRGRESKHRRLAVAWGMLAVDSSGPLPAVLAQLAALPALRALGYTPPR
jgi:hypothetical protein